MGVMLARKSLWVGDHPKRWVGQASTHTLMEERYCAPTDFNLERSQRFALIKYCFLICQIRDTFYFYTFLPKNQTNFYYGSKSGQDLNMATFQKYFEIKQ